MSVYSSNSNQGYWQPSTKTYRLLEVGEKYKHFKGTEYWVIGLGIMGLYQEYQKLVTKTLDDAYVIYAENWLKVFESLACRNRFICRHSETNYLYETFLIKNNGDSFWCFVPICEWLDGFQYDAWIRDYNNFMELRNDNQPRFEICLKNYR